MTDGMKRNKIDDTGIIEVKNLYYRYPVSKKLSGNSDSYKEVLKGISLSVNRGEKISVIGPNGAGKSTLMLNIAGLLDEEYRRGKIFIEGRELNKKNIYNIREKIGFVFQDPNDQLFSIKVFDDVAFGLVNYLNKRKDRRVRDKNYIDKKVNEALEKVGLKDIGNEMPHFLSFGEKKLVSIATVLSYDPEILILDEPSSNLDSKNRANFIRLVRNMKKTIVAATHDLDMAYDISDRCVIINEGKVAADGHKKSILNNRNLLEDNNLDLPLIIRGKRNLKDSCFR